MLKQTIIFTEFLSSMKGKEANDFISGDNFYTMQDDRYTMLGPNDEEKKILTGDVNVDSDIIKFFQTRQAVFKKITETKKANQEAGE